VSLIALSTSYASKLTVTSCTFENFFFPYGLITNAYFKWNRNLPYASFMGPQNCRDINPALTTPCYLLTLEQNTFTISAIGHPRKIAPGLFIMTITSTMAKKTALIMRALFCSCRASPAMLEFTKTHLGRAL
jgi:hypothetical protein